MDVNNNNLNRFMQIKQMFKQATQNGGTGSSDGNLGELQGELQEVVDDTKLQKIKLSYDINGDGKLNINDLILVNKGIKLIKDNGKIDKKALAKLSADEQKALDLDGDGKVSAREMNLLKSQFSSIQLKLKQEGYNIQYNEETGTYTQTKTTKLESGGTSTVKIIYDSQGRKIESTTQKNDDKGNETTVTKIFDPKTGNLKSKKTACVDAEGNKTITKEEYDELGRLKNKSEKKSDGTEVYTEYKYKGKNTKCSMSIVTNKKDGKVTGSTKNHYTRDDNGRVTKKISVELNEKGKKTGTVKVTEFVRNENGDIESKVTTVTKNKGKKNEKVVSKKTTQYNSDGSYSIEKVKYNEDGSTTTKIVKYNKEGKVVGVMKGATPAPEYLYATADALGGMDTDLDGMPGEIVPSDEDIDDDDDDEVAIGRGVKEEDDDEEEETGGCGTKPGAIT